eukprot:scaffold8679_cov154-Skeletonema_menzelii.AAC.7
MAPTPDADGLIGLLIRQTGILRLAHRMDWFVERFERRLPGKVCIINNYQLTPMKTLETLRVFLNQQSLS